MGKSANLKKLMPLIVMGLLVWISSCESTKLKLDVEGGGLRMCVGETHELVTEIHVDMDEGHVTVTLDRTDTDIVSDISDQSVSASGDITDFRVNRNNQSYSYITSSGVSSQTITYTCLREGSTTVTIHAELKDKEGIQWGEEETKVRLTCRPCEEPDAETAPDAPRDMTSEVVQDDVSDAVEDLPSEEPAPDVSDAEDNVED